ncbi:MerC mercury resistance protein [Tenacibaculum sp. MAR_2009_124]|uniref:MerC domain-containing protein n=1 Tax=Tenacibaculum sp. MAR_2009_124 TaxID=1250059 RepID=UPI000894A658|nr:MerC domain-containing protein [Tenacibaculum sp. MAR_2009_124]SEC80825.1 MerC mercury resistance protein [Tenacibaculum sp. MAR_2009_124]
MIRKLTIDSNNIGIISSSLCFVHCLATPFLFLAKTCSVTCCESSPVWWRLIDFSFLLVSFYAVYSASKSTSKNWIKVALYLTWIVLFAIILNEYFHFIPLFEEAIYLPSFLLIGLHFHNKKHCKDDNCNV